jgi:diacylglycerol kinase family enzyme
MVSIMNGRRLGGGFWTAPNAEQDDGRLDLCIAHQVSRRRILTLLPYFIKGTQETQDEITMGKASSIKITAIEGVLPAQADGEILCTDGRQLKIEVLPHHLDVLCPPITKQA